MLDYFNTEILPELDKLNTMLDAFNQTLDEFNHE